MHRAFLAALLLASPAAAAEIRDAAGCEAAIAESPEAAREQASLWKRLGGGADAELCEAAALEAMGADGSAALILTNLAENKRRLLAPERRVSIYEHAARLWLADGRPDLALAILDNLDRVAPPRTESRLVLRARAQAAEGDHAAAAATLAAAEPGDAGAKALRAAALRLGGDPAAARAEADAALALAPDLPEALFEAAAAAAATGDPDTAEALWLRLIAVHPDHPLATAARRNLAADG
ncbi:hypothetical protein [Amaricoccus sp.]|uniref:hypothetical protein n=1 Tax=Amaricoccus sp. TaxID=1872485 RepID=UPI001B7C06F6|nr:hypothetical protein [Amaricoccus sp.]MBP7000612.1 hypothetical protein [Amaricoccus sp.]